MARISIIKEATVDPFLNNVSLLLPFDGSFNDASNNNFTVTANGNAQISSAQSKFGGSSALFDGNGDYLVLEDDADFNLASTPFTIEAWIYPTLVDSTVRAVIAKDTYGSNFSWCLAFNNTKLACYTSNIAGDYLFEANASVQVNTWQHIAVTSDGTTQRLFLNGQLLGTKNAPITNALSKISIGCFSWNNPGAFYQGYIDDLRVTKGVARYVTNFTPPNKLSIKSGKLNIQRGEADLFFNNVSLLLPMDTSFADFSSNNFTVTANGNVQISSAQSKFGGGSAYFDGNGDYLSTNQITLDTQDFTLECWIYLTTYGSQNNTIFNQGNIDNTGAFLVLIGSATNDRKLIFYANNLERFRGATTIPLNTWTNITVTRQSNIYYFFINGVLEGTHFASYNHNQTPFKIGDGYGGVRYFNGYIDDLRITKGVARYTSNFTPPELNIGKINISKSTFPIKDLVAFWKFNENNTTPSVGNPSYFLTNPGSITYSTGKVGGGINLPEGSRIRVDENLWDMVASPTSYSVAFWVKKNAISPSPQGAVIAGSIFGPMNFHFSFGIVINGSNSSFENGITYGQVTGATQYTYINAPFSINLGEWIHVVGTYDLGTSTRKLYVNGNLIETQNGITPPTSVQHYDWNGFAINGSTIGTNSSEYGGDHSFDAFGLWSRALTNVEIAALYNNGNGAEP